MEEKWIIVAWTCDRDIVVCMDEDGNSQTFDSEDAAITFASELTSEWVAICIN